MIEEIIVDTNVPLTASGLADHASIECAQRCIAELVRIQSSCRLLLDTDRSILAEYEGRLGRRGQMSPGDLFVRWLWDNQANVDRVREVSVTASEDRVFEEFPDDQNLASFDRDDRKFVAVALAAGSSPDIVNATDTDWWNYRDALQKHGITVRFLCPELMAPD